MIAGNLVLCSFNLSVFIDNQNGFYPINKPLVFVGVLIGQFLFGYVVMKIAQFPLLRETNAVLSDLEHQVTEATNLYDTVFIRKMMVWGTAEFIICTIFLILGILKAQGY